MREASIILPRLDNNGADLGAVHSALQGALIAEFGGFTAQTVFGGWKDEKTGAIYQEESLEYRIASDWTPADRVALDDLAALYCAKAGQLAVYVRHANGAVSFAAPAEPVESRAPVQSAAARRAAEFGRSLERAAGRVEKEALREVA